MILFTFSLWILAFGITDWTVQLAQADNNTSIAATSTSPTTISSTILASTSSPATQQSTNGPATASSSSSAPKDNSVTSSSSAQVSITNIASPGSVSSAAPASTIDPLISQGIVNGLIKSLVPSGSVGGTGSVSNPGAIGLLPAISKLSGPLAQLIVSNGTPSADNVNQLLRIVPDMAVMASLSNSLGAAVKSSPGQQPAPPSNFTNLTPQQVNDMISGAAPLPPMSSLPQEYINTVLSGGTLPGLTMEQTQALKSRYMQQMFSGGGGMDSLFGHPDGSVQAPVSATNGSTTTTQINQSIATNQSISGDQPGVKSIFSGNVLQELQNLDLSQLSPEVLQGFMKGDIPDLSKIPQGFLQSLIYKSPQLFANIVSSELQKKFANRSVNSQFNSSSISNPSIGGDQLYGKPAPYDVNSLDRKADISMFRQADDDHKAMMYTGIVLGVVGFLTIILIGALCWRRHRRRNHQEPAVSDQV